MVELTLGVHVLYFHHFLLLLVLLLVVWLSLLRAVPPTPLI
jgi:hypothetical protein